MRPLPAEAQHQFGVFTTAQALTVGWSPDGLERAARSGRLNRLRRGAYAVEPDDGTSAVELAQQRIGQRGVAAALRIPTATVSHAAAAVVHGLPLVTVPDLPCITLQPPLITRQAALHLHRQVLTPCQLDQRARFPLTSVARSCIDLTREQGLAAGLAATDAALNSGLCSSLDLHDVYQASCRGRAGLKDGRKLLELMDGNAESPLESVSRLAIGDLPRPRTQVVICSLQGRFIARVDFYWDEFGVIGEADGRSKYSDDALWREKRRQDALSERGLVVVRWGWSDARKPGRLRQLLLPAFDRARQLRSANVPIQAAILPPQPALFRP